jgi:hypothetical protein
MKNRVLVAFIILFPLGLLLFFLLYPAAVKTRSSGGQKSDQDQAVRQALAGQSSNTVAIIQSNFARVQPRPEDGPSPGGSPNPPPGAPAPLQFTNFPPVTVLQNMSRAIRQYGQQLGGNPVGTNPEITRQLGGENPKHINFISAEAGMRVNENGELVDPWGTPYFFHQLSGREMEIHSAGPDKVMWSADDLVTR